MQVGFIISDVLRHITSDIIRPSHTPVHSATRNQSFNKFYRLQQHFFSILAKYEVQGFQVYQKHNYSGT